jgi:hypothetical protein
MQGTIIIIIIINIMHYELLADDAAQYGHGFCRSNIIVQH